MSEQSRIRRLEEKHAREDAKERKNSLRQILSEPTARRWLWYVLSDVGAFRSVFNSENPHVTSYNSGKQDVGHAILAEILAVHPEAYTAMQKESEAKYVRRSIERDSKRDPGDE